MVATISILQGWRVVWKRCSGRYRRNERNRQRARTGGKLQGPIVFLVMRRIIKNAAGPRTYRSLILFVPNTRLMTGQYHVGHARRKRVGAKKVMLLIRRRAAHVGSLVQGERVIIAVPHRQATCAGAWPYAKKQMVLVFSTHLWRHNRS